MIDLQNLTELDKEHIAEEINKGYLSGDLNTEGQRGSWELTFEKWDDNN